MIRPIELCGPDITMDHKDLLAGGPGLNLLPPLCNTCKFPDIDFVPNPYYLIRSRAARGSEMAPAELGNLLVKPRVKQIFEIVIPGLCDFHPTYFQKSTELTEWVLAVPKHFGSTGAVSSEIQRCADCGQPVSANPGSQYEHHHIHSGYDLAKAINWASSVKSWSIWIHRSTLMSVRLFRLLKSRKVKGMHEVTGGTRPETAALKEELAWVELMQRKIEDVSTAPARPAAVSDHDIAWFEDFLKSLPQIMPTVTTAKTPPWNPPPSFLQVFGKIGTRKILSIEGAEMLTLLPPDEWQPHRLSDPRNASEDDPQLSVTFASTDHGDDFCFDAAILSHEFPVYLYNHEIDCYELYAQNFIQMLQTLRLIP